MTREEASDWLKCLKEIHEADISDVLGTWYKDIKNDHNEVIDMAIEALEKQTPKKPKHVITNMWINGNFQKECPSCGWLMFERVTTKDASEPVVCRICKFCQSCGQAIDWSES